MTVNNENAVKDVVVAATTANITLSGQQTIDGVSVVAGDRVLAKNQSTASLNGIWICDVGAWRRADDFVGGDAVVTGTKIPVAQGTSNGNTEWEVTNTGTISVGSTSLTFAIVVSPGGAVIGTEETSPSGTETWGIDDGGTPKYISLDTVNNWMHARRLTVNTITADTTLTSTYRRVICDASTASANPTLPVGSSAEDYILACIDATNGVTVIPSSNDVIGPLSSTAWALAKGETLHVFYSTNASRYEVQ